MLERETETTLLRREPRGVTLTPAGRAALSDARRAIEAAASAVRAARAANSASGGSLRLACAQSLVSVLAPVILEWHDTHPEVAISLRESTTPSELYGLLDSDEVDIVLMPGPGPERFTSSAVAEEEIVLVTPADHPLATKPDIGLQDLDGVSLVHFAPENGLSTWLDAALAKAGVRPDPVMRTSVTSAAPQLAAAGLGVAVCPASALITGFTGVVRSFSPRWIRRLDAVSPFTPDALTALFISSLRSHGVPLSARGESADTVTHPPARQPSAK